MGRMIKSISLPPHLAAKAEDIPNFSAFVQDALERHGHQVSINACRPIPLLEVCNGVRKPTCGICYPRGPPNNDEWLRFRKRCLITPKNEGPGPSHDELKITPEEVVAEYRVMLKEIDERIDGIIDLKAIEDEKVRSRQKGASFIKRLKMGFLAFKESGK
tara:strand:- start:176 stop:655 length:480 start_codon:yes stop_codon:yes gene_type:complete